MPAPIVIEARNPSEMTGEGNHTYLLVASDGAATLVDAGVGHFEHLAEIDRHLRDQHASLDRVLVTHSHSDHASGAGAIARRHPEARIFKFPSADDDRYSVRWHPLADGDRVPTSGGGLLVMHTAGHSPDHLVFWHESTRTAFVGDLVVKGGSVMIHASGGGDLGQYLASLERVAALEPTKLLPAHGPAILDPAAVLRGYIEHRLMREQQVVDALAAGKDSVRAIADSIYDGLAAALVPAARETVQAHLEKLARDGRAIHEDGRWRATR